VHHLLGVEDGGAWTLWAATDKGPARLSGKTWVPALQGLPNPWTWKLARLRTPAGTLRLLVCTRGGVFAWDGDRWASPADFKGLQGLEVNDILSCDDGSGPEWWVSVWNRGPARWTPEGWQFQGSDAPRCNYPVSLAWCRSVDGSGILWVGTYEDGLACLKNGRWQLLTTDRGLRSNGIYALLPGGTGRPTVWIGSQGGGVTALSLEGWVGFLDRQSGLPSVRVSCMLEPESSPNRFLFGTHKGLVSWDEGHWRLEGIPEGLPDAGILALAELEERGRPRLYAGTAQGLARKEGSRWTLEPGCPRETVNALLADPERRRLLVGTPSGLHILSGGAWTHWSPDAAGEPVEVLSIAVFPEAAGGDLWVGTRGHGIWRQTRGTWQRMDPMPRYPKQWITALKVLAGPSGSPVLWAGTRGNGLARWEPSPAPAWRVYDGRSAVPLPHTVIFRIEQDRRGRLYLGTTGGIVRLSFAQDGTTPLQVETFTVGDGLLTTLANQGASMVDRKGRVWFGFPEGAAFLDPAEEPLARTFPRPILEKGMVGGKGFDDLAAVSVSHRENHLSFDFLVPWYHREEDVRFRTQMVGLEDAPGPWRYSGSREFAGLSPGRYALKVWARNHAGTVSEPLEIPIRIAAPLWANPVAYSLYVLALSAALILFIRIRTHVLARRNEWLERKVEAATSEIKGRHLALEAMALDLKQLNEEKSRFLGIAAHDLRNPLNVILLQTRLLETSPGLEGELPALSRITQSAKAMQALIERLLGVNVIETGKLRLDLGRIDLQILAGEVCDRFEQAARSKGIELVLEQPKLPPMAMGDIHAAGEVLDNLVSNAIKFMPPGPPRREVRIAFESTPERIALVVTDQGPGFSAEDRNHVFDPFAKLSARPTAGEPSTGLGLSITRKLAEAMDGRIELESTSGQGATFRFWLPRA
jgi:signal transduction histidine kinase/ligand-binding sensor domain-containing protein